MESTRYKRRAPRVATTGWAGKYIVEDDPASGWSQCRVKDFSIMGVGLEFSGDAAQDLIGRRIIVQVQSQVEESLNLRLAGEIRNMSPGPAGGTRAGLELVGISETERAILRVMELMKVTW